ncbi:shikimate kinase [Flagellimonas meishanensis]|uniref:shikimate kinase n=1 Tax=Flagellimonas meishanensis TaxID=2873264 RepID=UPI001CA6C4D7|nr:shikimate kinase [[Muricauda] meishanensis]
MKVVLVGYMASGKTSVGKLLAQELDMEFIDLDDHIENELQKPVKDIFAEKGEIHFRRVEHEMLRTVLNRKKNIVLSTGGGTPCYGNNMDLILEKSDHSIYLQLPVQILVDRIKKEMEHRPLVSHLNVQDLPEFIGKHLFERRPFYMKAKHTVQVGNKDVQTLLDEIKDILL